MSEDSDMEEVIVKYVNEDPKVNGDLKDINLSELATLV